ncbi:MAG: hypothetical protein C0404_07860 [Verrucomicrobia bacterium]|nr:hypothetical protein [Verrucomicrobiota bacterium]
MNKTMANLICACAVAATATVVLYRNVYEASNLDIVPDSVEYAVGASHLAGTGKYYITVDGRQLPPRYSPWFSAMLAPAYGLLGCENPGNGIFVVTLLAIAGVLAAYAIGFKLSGPAGGFASAAIILLLPDYLYFGRLIMTDVPACTIGLLAFLLFVNMTPEDRLIRGQLLLAGVLIAAGAALRPAMAALVLPFLITAWRTGSQHKDRFTASMILVVPLAAILILTSIYNMRTFGSAFRNGYNFWGPVPYDYFSLTFSFAYLGTNMKALFHAKLPQLFIVLILLAAVLRTSSAPAAYMKAFVGRSTLFILLAAIPLIGFHVFYFYPDTRFFLPITCLVASICGGLIGMFLSRTAPAAATAVSLAFLIVAGAIGLTGGHTIPYRRMTVDAIRQQTPADAVIVSSIDPAYLEFMLPGVPGRTVVPLNRSVEYASKLIAARRLPVLTTTPAGPQDHRCEALLKAGGEEAVRKVFMELIGPEAAWPFGNRRVFIDVASLAVLGEGDVTMLRQHFTASPVSDTLVEITPRAADGR